MPVYHYLDFAWKTIITELVEDAILFFLPDLARDMDSSGAVQLLDGNLSAIGADTEEGKRVPDLCFSVPLSGGDNMRVAFVIEQQHRHDAEFGRRMYEGYYRTSDRLKIPVTSLAIFTGSIPAIGGYSVGHYGTELVFRYNSYRVLDADAEELAKDERLFAPVILAGQLMLKAGGRPEDRVRYAKELIRLMRERSYDREKKRNIFNFIGRVLKLEEEDIDENFRKEVWTMKWVPLAEAQKKMELQATYYDGELKGLQQGVRQTARNMKALGLSFDLIAQATGLSESEIRQLD